MREENGKRQKWDKECPIVIPLSWQMTAILWFFHFLLQFHFHFLCCDCIAAAMMSKGTNNRSQTIITMWIPSHKSTKSWKGLSMYSNPLWAKGKKRKNHKRAVICRHRGITVGHSLSHFGLWECRPRILDSPVMAADPKIMGCRFGRLEAARWRDCHICPFLHNNYRGRQRQNWDL